MTRSIKDLPVEERPRERLLEHGAKVLSDAEVLAVLLRTGRRGESVLDVSQQLLRDGWQGLMRKSAEEMVQIPGLGKAKAAMLLAALEIGHRVRRQGIVSISGPEDALALVSDMRDLNHEEFRVLYLNTKGHVLGAETVFRGGLNGVDAAPREIFRRAIARSSASVIVVHNHPSGDPTPSVEDRQLTKRLESAGDLLGIAVLDHLIVGRSRHLSLNYGELTD